MSLSERLREVARGIYHPSLWDDLSEAATTIETQAAEIERLRAEFAEFKADTRKAENFHIENTTDLITELGRLRASLAEAVRVLRPFGEAVAHIDDKMPPDLLADDEMSVEDALFGYQQPRIRDLRAARDFITKHGGERE